MIDFSLTKVSYIIPEPVLLQAFKEALYEAIARHFQEIVVDLKDQLTDLYSLARHIQVPKEASAEYKKGAAMVEAAPALASKFSVVDIPGVGCAVTVPTEKEPSTGESYSYIQDVIEHGSNVFGVPPLQAVSLVARKVIENAPLLSDKFRREVLIRFRHKVRHKGKLTVERLM